MTKKTTSPNPFGGIPIAGHATPKKTKLTNPAPSFSRRNVPPKNRNTFSIRMILLALATGVAFYLAFGFLLLPYLIKGPVANHLANQLERSVTIAQAKFNPVTLKLTINNAIVGASQNDPNDSIDPFLSFSTLQINFAANSVFKKAVICQQITLSQPFVHIAQGKNSPPNIITALNKLKSGIETLPKWLTAIISGRYSLNNISIIGGEIKFDDLSTGKSHLINELNLTFPALANIAYQTPYVTPSFTAKINGSLVSLQKMTNMPGTGETRVAIKTGNIDITPYSSYLLPKGMEAAEIKGQADIDLELVITPKTSKIDHNIKIAVEGQITLKNLIILDRKDLAKIKSMDIYGAYTLGKSSPAYHSIVINSPNLRLTNPTKQKISILANMPQVEKIKIINGNLTINHGQTSPKDFKLQSINAAFNFSNPKVQDSEHKVNNGTFVISGTSNAQGRFNSQGSITLAPFSSQGQLNIEHLPVNKFPALPQHLAAYIYSGQLQTIQSHFNITSGHRDELISTELREITILAHDLVIKNKDETLAVFGSLKSANGSFNSISQTLNLGKITINQANLFLIKQHNKSAWQSLADIIPQKKGQVKISRDSLDLQGKLIVIDSKESTRPITLNNLLIKERLGQAAIVTAEAQINQSAPIAVQGTYKLAPFSSVLKIKANDLSLANLSPYLRSYLPTNTQGRITIDGEFSLPAASYSGKLRVSNFKTVNEGNFINWQGAYTTAITIQTNPLRIKSDLITIDTPQLTYNSTDNPKSHKLFSTPTNSLITIKSLEMKNSRINWQATPAALLSFHDLDAKFSGIDLAANSKATFELTGKDRHNSKLELSGSATFGLKDSQIIVKGGLQDINLALISPKTAPFIGYQISKGTGKLTGSAIITENDLTADSTLVIHDLTLGKPIPHDKIKAKGKSWQNLPLLQSLLQDRNGKIEVQIPIDTQSASINPGQTARNRLRGLLLKSLVSPFFLLSKELASNITDHIFFEPGDDKITPEMAQKLGDIAAALKARPLLRLDIAAYADSTADRNSFKKKQELEIKRRQHRHEENLSLALSSAYGKEVIEGGTSTQFRPESFSSNRKISVSAKELQRLAQNRGLAVQDFLITKGISESRLSISKNELVASAPLGRPGSRVDFNLLLHQP